MKEMMKRALVFITFEQLGNKSQIEQRYQHLSNAHQLQNNTIGLIVARHQIIYEYWYNHFLHFCFMLLVATITTHFAISKLCLPAVAIAGTLSYSILYVFNHRFIFNSILLRDINIVEEEYRQKVGEEIKKCRKAQYSNFALTLIDKVNAQISGMAPLSCDDKSALMLTDLYGVDPGSMKKNLELLYIKNKRKYFSERNKTEYKNCFDEAYGYFEKRHCLEGAKKVKELEMNFFINNTNR